MPTTPKGFRYPASTDRVADGATAMQNLATDVDTWATASGCAVTRAGAAVQLSPNSQLSPVPWDGEAFDTDNYHDNASHPGVLVMPTAGLYVVQLLSIYSADAGNSSGDMVPDVVKVDANDAWAATLLTFYDRHRAVDNGLYVSAHMGGVFSFAAGDRIASRLANNTTAYAHWIGGRFSVARVART